MEVKKNEFLLEIIPRTGTHTDYLVDINAGKIIDKRNGREKTVKNGRVQISMNGKKHTLIAGRIVLEAYYKRLIDKSLVLVFKDNNPDNIKFENLDLIQRTEYFAKLGNRKLLSEEQQQEIRKLYNREEQRKVNYKGPYPSISDLARQYGCSKSTILKVLNETY